ncbi:MAG: zincin-like metallopeptidase domain-containing protein [Acidithiobacillus sp.]|nr:zincin-like metallopeptidase domain-containing protein [Acidithiobacillus sp.]
MTAEKKTAAEIVADQIITMINDPSGVPSWRKPWTPPPGPRSPTNALTEKSYRGGNAIVMALGRFEGQTPLFATFNQWKTIGEREGLNLFVKKGEKSTPIMIPIFKKDEENLDKNGEPKQKLVGTKLAFGFQIFQTQEGEAFFERQYGDMPPPKWDMETIWPVLKNRIEEMVKLTIVPTNQACYDPNTHEIFMPKQGQFPSDGQFYATILHELTHATERADEAFEKSIQTNKLIKKDASAYRELRAELGSLLLAQTMGLPMETSNSASYIEGWGLRHFAEKHQKMILQAANYAQNAVDMVCTPEFMLALQEARNNSINVALKDSEPIYIDPKTDVNTLRTLYDAVFDRQDVSITPADLEAGKRYTVTSDPGHGWMIVPKKDIEILGIAHEITPFSYVSPRGGKIYLEEDCDAPRFVDAYAQHYGLDRDTLWRKIAVEHNIDRQATCRSYDHFDPSAYREKQDVSVTTDLPLTSRVAP